MNESSEMIVVEDNPVSQEDYVEHLHLGKDIETVCVNSIEKAKELLAERKRRAWLVDICLGVGREKEGIDIIKLVKDLDGENSFIIAYTGHVEYEDECREAGADLVFLKNGDKTLYDFLAFQMIFSNFLKDIKFLNENWKNETKIPSKIIRSDKEYVYLNCMIDTEKQTIVEKIFPKTAFMDFKDLSLDKSILITIREKAGKVCFTFDDAKDEDVNKFFIVRAEYQFDNNNNNMSIFEKDED